VVSDPSGLAIGVAPDFQAAPAVAASGANYLVVWQDGRNSATTGLDIFGTRVSAGGSVLDASGLGINTGLSDQQFPSVASGSARTFLVVSQGFGNGANRTVGNLVSLDDLPVITRITKTGGSVTVTWNAIIGRTYRVQFKSDVAGATWTDLSGDVTAVSTTASKTDSTIGSAARRFYRVLLLP
jgi:hypothetical protein